VTQRGSELADRSIPYAYTIRLIARRRDGSEAEIQIDDYGNLRELLEHLADMADARGWLEDSEADTA
jgi:hypothetical protein